MTNNRHNDLNLEAAEAYAELQAARARHWAAVEEGESPLIIRNLQTDVRNAAERYQRLAYATN